MLVLARLCKLHFFAVLLAMCNAQLPCTHEPTEADRLICAQLSAWSKNNLENPTNVNIMCRECDGCMALVDPNVQWSSENCKKKCTKQGGVCGPIISPETPCAKGYEHICANELNLIAKAPMGCPETPFECMDLNCFQAYLYNEKHGNGNQLDCFRNVEHYQSMLTMRTAFRKEYRVMSNFERDRFHNALKILKTKGVFDRYAATHGDFAIGGSAHAGPGFLPWHREFLKRFEFELRKVDPMVALPYWDTTLDARLPNPRDSILWTKELLGSTDSRGRVVDGPFANFNAVNWTLLNQNIDWQKSHNFRAFLGNGGILYAINFNATKYAQMTNAHITRRLGVIEGSAFLLNISDVNWFLSQDSIEAIMTHTMPISRQCPLPLRDRRIIEWTHGKVHMFVGGDMAAQTTTANDPVFYLLHSFVDMLWELWRQQHQNRWERENLYPKHFINCSTTDHQWNEEMAPFRMYNNLGGLSNLYTDYLYNYQNPPACFEWRPDCSSKYLFCDQSHGIAQCVSKIRIGGDCRGFFNGEDACYEGECINGRCIDRATAYKDRCKNWCNSQCSHLSGAFDSDMSMSKCLLECHCTAPICADQSLC